MRQILPPLVLIAVELFLSGCLPVTSSSPLGTTVAATSDSALTGMWKGNFGSAKGAAYATFYPGRDGKRKIVLLAPPTAGDDGGWMVFEARSARLKDNSYLDVREIEEDGKAPDPRLVHVPVLYRIGSDGLLVLYLVDEKAARTAIETGEIAGTIEPGEIGDVIITATPAALDRFFASEAGRVLFTKPFGTFRRAN